MHVCFQVPSICPMYFFMNFKETLFDTVYYLNVYFLLFGGFHVLLEILVKYSIKIFKDKQKFNLIGMIRKYILLFTFFSSKFKMQINSMLCFRLIILNIKALYKQIKYEFHGVLEQIYFHILKLHYTKVRK